MIRLVTLLKRKPGTTHEQFLDHWHNVHGPLIARLSAADYVLRYEQHPAAWPADGKHEPPFDGVTIQWFESVESFFEHTTLPDQAEMFADTERFLDTANLHWILTEEPTVVFDKLGGDGI